MERNLSRNCVGGGTLKKNKIAANTLFFFFDSEKITMILLSLWDSLLYIDCHGGK